MTVANLPRDSISDQQRPVVVFVLGGPGSGKGTQCARIVKEFGYHHISAGDCLREERERPGSKFGELIEGHILAGSIVPVEITCELLRMKMREFGWEGGKFLIDGFPRNQNNLDGWLKACPDVDIKFCLRFDCPEDVMETRLLKRAEKIGRIDDNIESIRKRFRTFNVETVPICNYFDEQGKCYRIQANATEDQVFEEVKKHF